MDQGRGDFSTLSRHRSKAAAGDGEQFGGFQGENISNATARPLEVLTTVAAIYFAVGFPLTQIVSVVERRILRRMAV